MSIRRTYLLVPAAGTGEGLGHLARCRRLADHLASGGPRGAVRPRVTFLASHLDEASKRLLRGKAGPEVIRGLKPGRQWDLIVLDRRETPVEELRRLQRSGPVVCLDEGGAARDSASFLIDAIPRLPGGPGPNLSSLSLLELPRRSRLKVRWPPRKILVSFGGEDSENLSSRLLDALLVNNVFSPGQITLVEVPLFKTKVWPPGVDVVRNASRLTRMLSAFDVVFCHFGITALEGLASGVPVILLNPSAYHAQLGRSCGFADIGIRAPDTRALKTLLDDGAAMQARVDSFNAKAGRQRRSWPLPGVLSSMRPRGKPRCPVCGRDGNRVVARFPDRTYRSCGGCGVTYLESFAEDGMEYGTRYFGAEYKAHYGRTYLEDFGAIKAASAERLRIIRAVSGESTDGVMVDVGCAFGPFLSAAADLRLACFGIDVSEQAVRYVRKELGVPAICSSFEAAQRRQLPRRISAITLWYVIEHFLDVDLVLRKASALLSAGGVLAFSTPNGDGISARKNLREFLDRSPPDHFTILRPSGLGRILAAHGFELQRVRITGHHPERFPGFLGKAGLRAGAGSRVLGRVSRLIGLGDTFEAYAVKVDQA